MVKLINARKHRKDQQAKETDRLEPKGTQTGLGPVQWPDANIVLPVYRADLNQDAIEQTYALRETINNNFDKVRALSDAVLFEFGASRQQDLAFRSRITRWQPQLRILFITRVALLKYRLQLPGFELPQPVRLAQHDFDEHLAAKLEGMADRLQDKARQEAEDLDASLVHLEESVRSISPSPGAGTANTQTLLLLSRRVQSLAASLERKCESFPPPAFHSSHLRIPRMRESKYRHRWNRSLRASDVEDGCECNLFKLGLRPRPVRERARPKCCSANRRASGWYALRTAAASPAPLDVPLVGHLSSHLAQAGLARKGQGKVCRKPNSSQHFYDLRFSRKQNEYDDKHAACYGIARIANPAEKPGNAPRAGRETIVHSRPRIRGPLFPGASPPDS